METELGALKAVVDAVAYIYDIYYKAGGCLEDKLLDAVEALMVAYDNWSHGIT